MMRALGYNRLISMENFRTPNFPLTGDILVWLVKRFDPDAEVHDLYTTEEDKVLLVRSAAEFMALKGNVMLNTKRIYQADGYAVRELLKIASLLYEALRAHAGGNDSNGNSGSGTWGTSSSIDVTAYIQDLRLSRELASQVTTKGATIYELLAKEIEMRDARNASINNLLELGKVESAIREAITFTKESIENTKSLIENVSSTESSFDTKIEKKQSELDRNQKRLQTLKKVRPAFLEEFERLEIELQQLYQEYITRTRCIAYLEQQQEEAAQAESERMQKRQKETMKFMEELQMEDARRLLDSEMSDVAHTGLTPPNAGLAKPTRRLRTATASKMRLTTGRQKVYGSMNPNDDDSNSYDSDSDLLLDDDDDDGNSEFLGSAADDMEGLPPESKSDPSDDDF